MSHSNTGSIVLNVAKTLIVSLLRLAGAVIMILCKLCSRVLELVATFIEKLISHGSSH